MVTETAKADRQWNDRAHLESRQLQDGSPQDDFDCLSSSQAPKTTEQWVQEKEHLFHCLQRRGVELECRDEAHPEVANAYKESSRSVWQKVVATKKKEVPEFDRSLSGAIFIDNGNTAPDAGPATNATGASALLERTKGEGVGGRVASSAEILSGEGRSIASLHTSATGSAEAELQDIPNDAVVVRYNIFNRDNILVEKNTARTRTDVHVICCGNWPRGIKNYPRFEAPLVVNLELAENEGEDVFWNRMKGMELAGRFPPDWTGVESMYERSRQEVDKRKGKNKMSFAKRVHEVKKAGDEDNGGDEDETRVPESVRSLIGVDALATVTRTVDEAASGASADIIQATGRTFEDPSKAASSSSLAQVELLHLHSDKMAGAASEKKKEKTATAPPWKYCRLPQWERRLLFSKHDPSRGFLSIALWWGKTRTKTGEDGEYFDKVFGFDTKSGALTHYFDKEGKVSIDHSGPGNPHHMKEEHVVLEKLKKGQLLHPLGVGVGEGKEQSAALASNADKRASAVSFEMDDGEENATSMVQIP
eukprot:g13107.t1